MVNRIDEVAGEITFLFEDRPVTARPGDTVASALTAAGIRHLRDSTVSGEARGIYCMMGACFDCLVEIDGVQNRQACMTPATEGLSIRRQHGGLEVEL